MGYVDNITKTSFPKQGNFLGRKTKVCFRYDTDNFVCGKIVRDDTETPFITIMSLDDGRFVLATERQYSHPE
jgi:hypothetical protein